jgi:hypothetical protein
MRGLFLSFSRPSPIVLVGLLVFSTHFWWAQRTSPLGEIPIQLLDTPAPFASVSEVLTPLHLTYRRLPLTFEQNQGQSDSRMRSFPYHAGDYRLPANAALYSAKRTAEQWGKEKYLIGSAPSRRRTFAPTYGKIPRETICCVVNLEHYTHRIPWAGSIILRIVQQAKAHPYVTRVMMVLQPQL